MRECEQSTNLRSFADTELEYRTEQQQQKQSTWVMPGGCRDGVQVIITEVRRVKLSKASSCNQALLATARVDIQSAPNLINQRRQSRLANVIRNLQI